MGLDKLNHTLWVERYRPSTLNEYISNAFLKEKMETFIKQNDIPHLLFYGKAGGGKTSLGKILTKTLTCDSIYINASKDNGVDIVRDRITGFASSMGLHDLKIVFLDEFDRMTPAAQESLRSTMEQFALHTRFILTANYHERIIEPIQSRVQAFQIVPPARQDVAMMLVNILKKEGIKFNLKDVALLVDTTYPDIRKTIGEAQKHSHDGVFTVDRGELIEADYKLKLLNELKDKKPASFNNIRQLIADTKLHDFVDAYRFLFDKVDEFTKDPGIAICILAEGMFQDAFVPDKEITFSATINKLLQA